MTGHVETLHRELSKRDVDFLIVRRFGPIADERLDFEFLSDDAYSSSRRVRIIRGCGGARSR